MAGFVLVMLTLVSDFWVGLITLAFVWGTVFMSITVFTGLGGQISLATASFATVGAFGVAHLTRGLDIPALLTLPIAAVGAAAVGAILIIVIDGLPAIVGRFTGRPPGRLTGLYLSLATLAFALMLEKTVFRRESVIKGDSGVEIPRPEGLDDAHRQRWLLVVLAVWALVAFLVILVRKGTTGRYMAALRGSDAAAASIGINARGMRIKLFAFSAGIAGLGGGLLTLHNQAAIQRETVSFLGIVWVVLVVTLGARTVDGAINAALGYVLFQNWLLPELGFEPSFAIVLFGLGAITYARHPEGIVDFQTRKNIVSQIRQRALGQRAKDLKSKGDLPREFRPVRFVAGPVLAGPALYFAYLLIGSLFTDGWLSVRSPTILFFILPSVLYGFAWILVTNFRLQRDGGFRGGWLVLGAGAGLGLLGGLWFDSEGWPLVASQTDRVLVGIAAGFAVAAFFLLPVHVQQIARKRNWLSTPISWRVGRAPAGFVLFGSLLFQRTTLTCSLEGSLFDKGCPPGGWPIFFLVSVWVIVWVQWVAGVQAAVNELAIGGEGFQPPEEKAHVAPREVAVTAPGGDAK
jgi:ABC-type branched-subunit amino acid transport system permease subunit